MLRISTACFGSPDESISARTHRLKSAHSDPHKVAQWRSLPQAELLNELNSAKNRYKTSQLMCQRNYISISRFMKSQSPSRPPIRPHPIGYYCLRQEVQIIETLRIIDLIDTTRSMDGFEAAVQAKVDQGLLPLDDVVGALIMFESATEWTRLELEDLGGCAWEEDGSWDLQEYEVSQETLDEFLGDGRIEDGANP